LNMNFTISECLVDQHMTQVPVHVADKLVKYHFPILQPIREAMGEPIYISKHSGYRSTQWELDNGRDGSSQHTFGDNIGDFIERDKHLGALDLTAIDLQGLLNHLLESEYNRVCLYVKKGFIHCDFKGDDFSYFIDDGNGWEFQEKREWKQP